MGRVITADAYSSITRLSRRSLAYFRRSNAASNHGPLHRAFKYLNRLVGAERTTEDKTSPLPFRYFQIRFQRGGTESAFSQIPESSSRENRKFSRAQKRNDPHKQHSLSLPFPSIFSNFPSIRTRPTKFSWHLLDQWSGPSIVHARRAIQREREREKGIRILEAYESRSRGGFPPNDRSRLEVAIRWCELILQCNHPPTFPPSFAISQPVLENSS